MRSTLAVVVLGCLTLSPAASGAPAPPAVTLADVYTAAAADYPSAFAALSFTPDGPITVAAGSTLTVDVVAGAPLTVYCSHAAGTVLLDGISVAATPSPSPGLYDYFGVPIPVPDKGPGVPVGKGPHVVVFTIPATVQTVGQSADFDAGGKPIRYFGPWVTAAGVNFSSLLPFAIVGDNTVKFVRQPSNTKANATLGPVEVAVVDAKGAVVADDESSTVLIDFGAVDLAHVGMHGTQAVRTVHGVATFADLSFDYPSHVYRLSARGFGLTVDDKTGFAETGTGTVLSKRFSVGKSAWKLRFIQQPTKAAAGATLSAPVTVEILDASGALAATDTSIVSLGLSGPRGAALHGTHAMAAVNGVATFTDLSVSAAGAFRLVASDLTFKSAKSKKFKISP